MDVSERELHRSRMRRLRAGTLLSLCGVFEDLSKSASNGRSLTHDRHGTIAGSPMARLHAA
ncbi:MAG: hypothetical protein M3P12_12300 [Gemmatimonadota bacterium]|nr:hypothetical protein [Gemmatimonadota bacterium]